MDLAILTAASLNGVITAARGANSHDLFGLLHPPRELLEIKYEIRRRHGAVLVGTNTVVTNDPTLTSHARPGFACVRATLDRTGRIPRQSRFFDMTSDKAARTLVGVAESTPRDYLDFLASRGVEAVVCGEERTGLRRFLAGLEARGIASVACEGGGILNRALLAEGLVDRVHLFLLPAVLDAGSVNLFEGAGAPATFRLESVERVGDYLALAYYRNRTPSG